MIGIPGRVKYGHEMFATLLMVLYSLSFAAVDTRLLSVALVLAGISVLFFPIYVAVSAFLRKGPIEQNLLLPFDIALVVAALTNVVSFGSPAFFAIMFIAQIFILSVGFFWSAYEFAREGRLMQFFLSFGLWSVVVVGVNALMYPVRS